MESMDREYLKRGIDNFGRSRILVVGDIILDQFIWGKVSRISPEAPVPVVGVEHETTMLGGAANVVNNIVASGGNVFLCGVVGNDSRGRELTAKLEELGVNVDGIIVEHGRPTTVKTRIIAHAQQVVRYDREKIGLVKPETTNRILDFIHKTKRDLSAIIVSDYGKGVVSSQLMDGLRSVISECNLPVTVDPNVKNFPLYKEVTIITPNHNEAAAIAGMEIEDEKGLLESGKKLLSNESCRAVLITRGADGMTLFEEDGSITHIESVARKVYDVTGAGDTVIAMLTLGITSGLDLRAAAYLSNLAAGLVVAEIGTSAVRLDGLKELVASRLDSGKEQGGGKQKE
ncbi:MAG: D-glycero-beta-D-manno-heptose-7-phosphate kinase [Deltaproteobacteria bacterium]|nr:D-glycero-beta-D-manno-heptose-7-phosphate kinase [Deltaproteobacteria bacterium]MBW2338967.1 D-glycero-beta-D-manno-heptose-7-phosphate kinase [Deltaproteobacteria bacterium]